MQEFMRTNHLRLFQPRLNLQQVCFELLVIGQYCLTLGHEVVDL